MKLGQSSPDFFFDTFASFCSIILLRVLCASVVNLPNYLVLLAQKFQLFAEHSQDAFFVG